MESIRGKRLAAIDRASLAARASGYGDILIDIGTGDGRYVRHVARTCPGRFAIGVDACRENLREVSRVAPPNAVFVIANALALPDDLAGLAAQVTINFPWGSLLDGLLAGHPTLLAGLRTIMRPGADLEIRLNESALAEAGWPLADGGARVRRVLQAGGFTVEPPLPMDAVALRACPTSWARRLATGREPRALYLPARLCSA